MPPRGGYEEASGQTQSVPGFPRRSCRVSLVRGMPGFPFSGKIMRMIGEKYWV